MTDLDAPADKWTIATVAECWRYPVKSLQGHREDALTIGMAGIQGDRDRALIDGGSGHLMSAKRTSALLDAAGRDGAIELPDGTRVSWDAPDVDDALSAW